MNPYPPDMLPEEEEPAVQPPVTSPRSRHQSAPPPRRSSGGGGWMGKLTLLVSLLALIVSSVTLFLILRPEEKPEEPPDLSEEEPVTFRFGDRTLTPLEGMPLNPYDREGFFLDQRGTSPNYFLEEEKRRAQKEGRPVPKDDSSHYAYYQAHKPVREQEEAVGHAVRAGYLYSGMADSRGR